MGGRAIGLIRFGGEEGETHRSCSWQRKIADGTEAAASIMANLAVKIT
jgi:hypothetical protein